VCAIIYVCAQPVLPTTGFFAVRANVITSCGVVVLPLCFLKLEHLAFTSLLSFVTHLYLFALIAYLLVLEYQDLRSSESPVVCLWGLSAGGFTYLTMLFFSVSVQMCVLPMYQELAGRWRSPQFFAKAVDRAFVTLFVFFAFFGSASYVLYGGAVSSDVLNNLPSSSLGNLARLGILLIVMGVFPLVRDSIGAQPSSPCCPSSGSLPHRCACAGRLHPCGAVEHCKQCNHARGQRGFGRHRRAGGAGHCTGGTLRQSGPDERAQRGA
jgi:hypothetical protein